MTRRSVAIVGAGLTGLACALAAAHAGAAVEVFEARGAAEPLPAHVEVVPNMLRDLAALGVADACVRAGFPYRRTLLLGQRGAPVVSLDEPRMAGARHPAALGITRQALHAELARAAAQAGVQFHHDARVLLVDQDAGGGARLHVARAAPRRVDLAVLACGAAGGLRERVFLADAPAPAAPWFYFLADRPRGLDDAAHAFTPQGDHLHLVPVSGAQAGVSLQSRLAPAQLEAAGLRTLLARFPAPLAALAPSATAPLPARRVATPGLLPQPWGRGALLAVGDCAHALPPQFGQSAAQGMEDAVVLGALLAQPHDVPTLTRAFGERRMPRVQQVMALVTQAARWVATPERDTDLLALARALHQVVQQPA